MSFISNFSNRHCAHTLDLSTDILWILSVVLSIYMLLKNGNRRTMLYFPSYALFCLCIREWRREGGPGDGHESQKAWQIAGWPAVAIICPSQVFNAFCAPICYVMQCCMSMLCPVYFPIHGRKHSPLGWCSNFCPCGYSFDFFKGLVRRKLAWRSFDCSLKGKEKRQPSFTMWICELWEFFLSFFVCFSHFFALFACQLLWSNLIILLIYSMINFLG